MGDDVVVLSSGVYMIVIDVVVIVMINDVICVDVVDVYCGCCTC